MLYYINQLKAQAIMKLFTRQNVISYLIDVQLLDIDYTGYTTAELIKEIADMDQYMKYNSRNT